MSLRDASDEDILEILSHWIQIRSYPLELNHDVKVHLLYVPIGMYHTPRVHVLSYELHGIYTFILWRQGMDALPSDVETSNHQDFDSMVHFVRCTHPTLILSREYITDFDPDKYGFDRYLSRELIAYFMLEELMNEEA